VKRGGIRCESDGLSDAKTQFMFERKRGEASDAAPESKPTGRRRQSAGKGEKCVNQLGALIFLSQISIAQTFLSARCIIVSSTCRDCTALAAAAMAAACAWCVHWSGADATSLTNGFAENEMRRGKGR
jgi:hypothetical protein